MTETNPGGFKEKVVRNKTGRTMKPLTTVSLGLGIMFAGIGIPKDLASAIFKPRP